MSHPKQLRDQDALLKESSMLVQHNHGLSFDINIKELGVRREMHYSLLPALGFKLVQPRLTWTWSRHLSMAMNDLYILFVTFQNETTYDTSV